MIHTKNRNLVVDACSNGQQGASLHNIPKVLVSPLVHADLAKFGHKKYFVNSSFLKFEFCEVFAMFRFFQDYLNIKILKSVLQVYTYLAKYRYFVFLGERAGICKFKDVKFNRRCEKLRGIIFAWGWRFDQMKIFHSYGTKTKIYYDAMKLFPFCKSHLIAKSICKLAMSIIY